MGGLGIEETETAQDELALAVERSYRLILGRPADPGGLATYVGLLRSGELTLPGLAAALAGSEEFTQRLLRAGHTSGPQDDPAHHDPDWIDVAELIKTVSVEDLAERAEGYFRAVDEPKLLLAKPLRGMAETPELLIAFGQVLRGLRPLPGMTVLDFGAGTCWTSRFLAQLGCRAIALDVSPTALDLGRQLFDELPVIGEAPKPEFLVFDGHRIDLPDASVDRILSFDAFHHTPNPADVIREMARVLRPGGIAAFSEPGARHSHQPMSQYEMRNYGIIENDVVIEDVWSWAQEAGFAEIRLCLFDAVPNWVDIETFHEVVAGDELDDTFLRATRASIGDRRMFWLRREGVEVPDSRDSQGLVGEVAVDDARVSVEGSVTVITGTCRVHNPGPRTWLPSDAEYGPVAIGVRLHLGDQTLRDLKRIPLPGQGVQPGAGVSFPLHVEIPAQPEGLLAVEFDLVSERICWFSTNGSSVAKVALG